MYKLISPTNAYLNTNYENLTRKLTGGRLETRQDVQGPASSLRGGFIPSSDPPEEASWPFLFFKEALITIGKVLLNVFLSKMLTRASQLLHYLSLCKESKDSLVFFPYIFMKSFMLYAYVNASSLVFSLHIHIIKSFMP